MSKNKDKLSNYIFPRWANLVPRALLVFLLFTFVSIVFVFWFWFSPKNLEVGYQPEQPIPFSHRLHSGELGLDCRYCHSNVEKASHANIPSTQVCMNCHTQIKKDSYKSGCEEETKILRSYGDTLRIEHAPNDSEKALMISQEYCAKRAKLSNINQSNCDGCCRTTYICKGNLTNEEDE